MAWLEERVWQLELCLDFVVFMIVMSFMVFSHGRTKLMTFIRLVYMYVSILNHREHAVLELSEHKVDLPIAPERVDGRFAILCVDVHLHRISLAELAISVLYCDFEDDFRVFRSLTIYVAGALWRRELDLHQGRLACCQPARTDSRIRHWWV